MDVFKIKSMIKWLAGVVLCASCALYTNAQEDTSEVEIIADDVTAEKLLSGHFNGTRVVNGHSTRMLNAHEWEYRIEHRFGDMFGPGNGAYTWFGLDQSDDIRMGFEFGLTNNLMIGVGRSKGASSAYRSLIDGFVKYRLFDEDKEKPFSLGFLGSSTLTYQRSSTSIYDVNYFDQFAHRLTYSVAALISKKIGQRLELHLSPTYVHRNYVLSTDVNSLFSVGAAAKVGITKQMGLVVEYYQLLNGFDVRSGYKNSLGVGVEFVTFGHTFTINLTNAKGFNEPQFITETQSDWLKGQFRLGFAVNRKFSW